MEHSRMRELSVHLAKQLQDEEDWKRGEKAKAIAELEELHKPSSAQSRKSNDAPPEVDNLHCKQKTGGNETTKHDTPMESPSMRELYAQHAKQPHDEYWKSQQKAKAIAKLEELNRRSSVQNRTPELNNLHRKQKAGGNGTTKPDTSTADTCSVVSAESLNAPMPANGVKNITVPIGSTPASNTACVSRGPLIHNVMSSAKNKEVNMTEHITHKSTSVT